MVYPPLNLVTVACLVGLCMVIIHAMALLRPEPFQRWLRDFPRSRAIGKGLLTIAAIWAFVLTATMDLGEFTKYRTIFLVVIAAAYVLTWKFVDEFLAVRALGMILLLIAEPVLEAAFLRPEMARLLVVTVAYAWITLGLFWIGMPYVLRDQISWLSAQPGRWRLAAWAGLIYGAIVLISPAILYR